MQGESFPVREGARQVFERYFCEAMNPEYYDRALVIFDEVAAYNERSIAIQFHTAMSLGKLEEVLSAYELMIDPDRGFLHLVPDAVTRAVEVRRFGDTIYGSVIGMNDPNLILALVDAPPAPKVFDLMSEDQPFLN